MKMTVLPIVVGALGTIPKELVKESEDLKIIGQAETIQTTTMMSSLRFRFFLSFLVSFSSSRGGSNAPTIIGITVTFMFHNFSSPLARSKNLFFFSLAFIFILWSTKIAKSTKWLVLSFLLINTKSDLLAVIEWSVCTSKSKRIVYIPFYRAYSNLCHLVVWSIVNLLHNSQRKTFPPCHVLILCLFATFTDYVSNHFISLSM